MQPHALPLRQQEQETFVRISLIARAAVSKIGRSRLVQQFLGMFRMREWSEKESSLAQMTADNADLYRQPFQQMCIFFMIGHGSAIIAIFSILSNSSTSKKLIIIFLSAIEFYIFGLIVSVFSYICWIGLCTTISVLKFDIKMYGFTNNSVNSWNVFNLVKTLLIISWAASALLFTYNTWDLSDRLQFLAN
jgi:hypothetical protein